MLKDFKLGDKVEAVIKAIVPNAIIKKVEGETTETNIESSEKTKMDIETLKTFSEENLAEGKEMAEEAKANYEAEEAMKAYTDLVDKKEKQDRIIRVAREELRKIGDDLKVFSK
ncbi:hypothetical protein LCGC14_2139810 [marine sediment metagenome]|uniref:Uncharacterized protein n=1 Tax=marine sediment metagenome TaxID=412755 RepID=A0A0F9GBV7_9ZZZZ